MLRYSNRANHQTIPKTHQRRNSIRPNQLKPIQPNQTQANPIHPNPTQSNPTQTTRQHHRRSSCLRFGDDLVQGFVELLPLAPVRWGGEELQELQQLHVHPRRRGAVVEVVRSTRLVNNLHENGKHCAEGMGWDAVGRSGEG